MLQELLKEFLGDDAKVAEFMEKMKENKIYTTSEENLDNRYSKLKGDYEALTGENKKSLSLIEELKKSSGNSEELQKKITDYEAEIAELKKQNEEAIVDSELKFALQAKGAKASHIDYLVFKAKNGETELQLDKDKKVKGLDDLIESLVKTDSESFESKEDKFVEVKDLQDGEDDEGFEPTSLADAIKQNYEKE